MDLKDGLFLGPGEMVHLRLHNRDAAGRYTSSLSPMPMLKVPEITVTCSIAGCECAGILKSAGSLMRKVKGTASFSGPSITAIFAPGGSAGTSVHWRSDVVTNACPSAEYAGATRKTQSPPKRAVATATCFTVSSLRCWKFSGCTTASGGSGAPIANADCIGD